MNYEYKGICIDDFSAKINPEVWFEEDASKFKWPLTNDPIKVIRTYNWNRMKQWVLWALNNSIKVFIGLNDQDTLSKDDIKQLLSNKPHIIGFGIWNEPKFNPKSQIKKDLLETLNSKFPNIPQMVVYSHKKASSYGHQSSGILAVNIYGLYGDVCCCDTCENNPEGVETLKIQLPWKGSKDNDPNFNSILENEINDMIKTPNDKFWLTEIGWSSFPVGCSSPDCTDQPDYQQFSDRYKRLVAWSNETNLRKNYEEFLKYNNNNTTTKPEYIFLMSLSDTKKLGTPRAGEAFGLYTDDTNTLGLPVLKPIFENS